MTSKIKINGKFYDRVPVDEMSLGRDNHCGDCGASVGDWHDIGCDQEECPKCHGQLISCGCEWTEFEESFI
jgi:hypothetical protein